MHHSQAHRTKCCGEQRHPTALLPQYLQYYASLMHSEQVASLKRGWGIEPTECPSTVAIGTAAVPVLHYYVGKVLQLRTQPICTMHLHPAAPPMQSINPPLPLDRNMQKAPPEKSNNASLRSACPAPARGTTTPWRPHNGRSLRSSATTYTASPS
jgi:hypothetical protein